MLRNWNSFFLVASVIIAITLFADGKINFETMLDNLETGETLIVVLKTVVVTAVGIVSLMLMIILLLVDVLISIIAQIEFPITKLFYEYIYLAFARGWYWDAHSGSHIFMACIILFGIGLLSLYLVPVRRRKKKFLYYKSKD